MWSHASSDERSARAAGAGPAPAAGKSSLTQKLPPSPLSSSELRAAVPAIAATRDPQVERDIAAGMGFFLAEYGGQTAAATGKADGKAAAPPGKTSASKADGKAAAGKTSASKPPPGKTSAGKALKPKKEPVVKASKNLIGLHAYLATEANGQDESGDIIVVAGDQWGLIVDQLDVTKKEKNQWTLYDATFLVQVELGDGARLWFPKEEVIEVVAGGIAAHDADGERQRHDEFAEYFNREMKPILGVFDGGLTHDSAVELFTEEQIEALWSFLLTKLIPGGLFTSMECRPALTVPQRSLVAAHIVAHGVDLQEKLDPSEDALRRARADFCYHWVQLVWNYAGINDGKGCNLGERGDRGPTETLSYGAGKSLLTDEEGNVLGQTPVAAEGTLGHYGKNAKNPLRTARRESLSQDQLRDMLRPGDWIWIYNGNGSAGGGHSVVFAGWGDEKAPQAEPRFEDPPPCPESLTEEHDGARSEVKVAQAFAYSQLNNNPKTDKEAGGRLHSLHLGPYFYRQFDAEKEKAPDSDGKSAYRITPVYCVTRPDPSSHPAGTVEEVLQYNRDKAVKDNLSFLKRNGLGLSVVRQHLAKRGAALRSGELPSTLDAKQSKIVGELLAAEDDSIEHVTELAALHQRINYHGKNHTEKVNGLLEKLHLDLEALGAHGASRVGELPELGQLGALALAANRRYCEAKSLDPAALLKIVGDKAAKAATSKRGKAASADDVAALQQAERSSPSELMALGYAVARWQVLDAKAASGWMLDVVHLVTKAELTAARLDGDE